MRQAAAFKKSLPEALKNLESQVRLMGGTGLVLSSNCTLGMSAPADPGVVAYFKWQGEAMAVPCDRWGTVAANVQAIALTLEAMRSMERWGAKHMIRSLFMGLKALPAPEAGKHWREVLGFPDAGAGVLPGAAEIEQHFRERAKRVHPDAGPEGSDAAMAELNAAREVALRECGGGGEG